MIHEHAIFGAPLTRTSTPELPEVDDVPETDRESDDLLLDEMCEDIPCTD